MKRKVLSVLLCAGLAVSVLAGCGSNDGGSTGGSDSGSGDAAESSDMQYVKDKGTLIVGITNLEPMDYKDESGEWVGFDADMAKAFAESLGVEVEFVEIDWDNKILELDARSIDCVWNGMTLTDEVTSSMACTNAYLNNAQVVVVPSDVADQDGNSRVSGAKAGTASKSSEPVTQGITKNISVDTEKKAFIVKWFRSLASGVPFTLDDDITMFQVFPDFSGTSLNAMGNACDQVLVYGKLKAGAVSENNDVEVYGHRDPDNNVIAKSIKNKATGTTITPDRSFSAAVAWVITLAVVAIIALIFFTIGVEGIIWAIILILCLTNLPLVFKILAAIFGFLFSFLKK